MKKVLLINLKKQFENVRAGWPHLGLVSIGSVLKKAGFEVLVLDYAYNIEAPDIKVFFDKFKPDIIGLSLYTSTWNVCDKAIDELHGLTEAVIMVGGPHASLNYEELLKKQGIDYIFTGEAEEKILDVCMNAKRNKHPEIVNCGYVDINKILKPDFRICYEYGNIKEVGFQLSRGCPYGCIYCQVKIIASRKIRYRNINLSLEDIENNRNILPNLKTVRIVDDCPSLRLDLFKDFVRKFIDKFPELSLSLTHLRADQIDTEALSLLKKAGCRAITIGVESGNTEVFNFIKKGAKIEALEKGCQLIKENGLLLYLAFIVGLPYSNYAREKNSLDLAKRINPYYIYWNMLIPFKGTEVYDWFEKHGKIYHDKFGTTLIDNNLQFDGAYVETEDFSLKDRERAQIRAVFETKAFPFRLKLIPRIFYLGHKYRVWPSVFYLFFNPRSLIKVSLDVIENDFLFPFILPIVKKSKIWPHVKKTLLRGYMKINLNLKT